MNNYEVITLRKICSNDADSEFSNYKDDDFNTKAVTKIRSIEEIGPVLIFMSLFKVF